MKLQGTLLFAIYAIVIWGFGYIISYIIVNTFFAKKIDEKYDISPYSFFWKVIGIDLAYCGIISIITIIIKINVFDYWIIYMGLFLISNFFALISTIKLSRHVWLYQTFLVGRVEAITQLIIILLNFYIIMVAWTDKFQFFLNMFSI